MKMTFYADVHISKEGVRQLADKGISIVHCDEVGLANATDDEQLKYAIENGYIMVSCDDDFERIHYEMQEDGLTHTGIIYFRMRDQCKSISVIVREISFLNEAAEYEVDLYNQLWRVKS